MMEIALSPYKPLSGKKAKKGQSSKTPLQVSIAEAHINLRLMNGQVGEAVKAILAESKAALKTLAARAAALASDDTHVPNGMLVNALKASGFTDLVRSRWKCGDMVLMFLKGGILVCETVRDEREG
jgi:hypothetical protein